MKMLKNQLWTNRARGATSECHNYYNVLHRRPFSSSTCMWTTMTRTTNHTQCLSRVGKRAYTHVGVRVHSSPCSLFCAKIYHIILGVFPSRPSLRLFVDLDKMTMMMMIDTSAPLLHLSQNSFTKNWLQEQNIFSGEVKIHRGRHCLKGGVYNCRDSLSAMVAAVAAPASGWWIQVSNF